MNKALEVCQKALQIFDRIEDQRGVATAYHQLGIIAQEKSLLDEAEQWYRKELEILEAMGREGFVNAWREATGGEEPRIDEIKVKEQEQWEKN
ncbi:MAG: tetratricopeptide repeat protein [Candidatus Methanospirareceae archaeon]